MYASDDANKWRIILIPSLRNSVSLPLNEGDEKLAWTAIIFGMFVLGKRGSEDASHPLNYHAQLPRFSHS
jgi:hypothetical protein